MVLEYPETLPQGMKCYFIESLLFAWLVVFYLEAVNLILSEQSMVKLRHSEFL